ncbi:MAG TPA: glucokinase [Candidatus Saccharimonadales bacterium]|nr:glucokinase [Candidatus Saccharimonadales bacterium]
MILVAGDVGGTKTLLCASRAGAGWGTPFLEQRYESGAYPNFAALLGDFLARLDAPAAHAAFGVAGPVIDGRCHATNLPWTLDEAQLAAALGLRRVRLVNDFVAAARGVLELGPQAQVVLQEGRPDPHGTMGVLGAGTGLGEAIIVWHAGRPQVVPTEGGHGDFAPRTDEEIELLRFLRARFGRVSYERLLSGPGIVNLYEFVRARGRHPESREVAAALAAGDPAAAVTRFAGDPGDPLCREALELFVTLYGAEAGNLALRVLATGGVFVAGGIAPRLQPHFLDGRFLEAFLAKGRYRTLLERVPVRLVTDDRAGLLGALSLAAESAGEGAASR